MTRDRTIYKEIKGMETGLGAQMPSIPKVKTESVLFGEDLRWSGTIILFKCMKRSCKEGETGLLLNDHERRLN